METNGVANILAILSMSEIGEDDSRKISDQCDLLLCYMAAVDEVLRGNLLYAPEWHEVVRDREQYRNLRRK